MADSSITNRKSKHSPKIPEIVLARIWEEQRFQPDSLKTISGHEVQVIRRGRRNTDNGPDFQNALIRIGDIVYEGDVELHLEVADWHAHGHEIDLAYNQTILHVVLWSATSSHKNIPNYQIRKANGQNVPTIIVQSCLSAPIEKLLNVFQRADEHKRHKIQRCQNTLQDIPLAQLLSRLKQLGTERLYERVQRFESWLNRETAKFSSPPLVERVRGGGKSEGSQFFQQIVYEAICEGLGYSSNKRPFLELARRLPLNLFLSHLPKQEINSPLEEGRGVFSLKEGTRRSSQNKTLSWIQAILFGTAGLLPPSEGNPGVPNVLCRNIEAETQAYLSELHSLWQMLSPCLDLKPMKPEEWHFFRLRPPNFPTRRLAALSYLIFNYREQPLFESYLQLFHLFSEHRDRTIQSVRLLERTLEIEAGGYWKGRYLFGKAVFPDHDKIFLGQSRIRDIVISAVFPVFLLYARHTSQPKLESLILRLYETFPSPTWNRVTKTICEQVFAHRKRSLPEIHTAVMYQGMIQLHRHYCYLPACTMCPLGSYSQSSYDTL